mgnify:CR=1 FL=1
MRMRCIVASVRGRAKAGLSMENGMLVGRKRTTTEMLVLRKNVTGFLIRLEIMAPAGDVAQ